MLKCKLIDFLLWEYDNDNKRLCFPGGVSHFKMLRRPGGSSLMLDRQFSRVLETSYLV